ncbi:MAG TPA: agmatinase [Stellaceae bacterium]|nr:agmatinase [Stellaceae bacterium]
MSSTPTYALPSRFLGVARTERSAAYCVAGAPFDIGTSFRSGARFGPDAIRQASRMLVDGDHPTRWLDPATLELADIGNFALALGDIPRSLAALEAQAADIAHLITLGGDHSITLALLRALGRRIGPLALVHFDAHVDAWPDTFGNPYGHASVFYHAIEEGLVEPRRTVQVGIRSPVPKSVYDWVLGKGVTIVAAETVHETGAASTAAAIRRVIGDAPAYLSFDIDALDPAFAPGTGTPEVGGLASWQVQGILRRLQGVRFRGMDVVEVAPPYDVSGITALAAATIAWEYLALVA